MIVRCLNAAILYGGSCAALLFFVFAAGCDDDSGIDITESGNFTTHISSPDIPDPGIAALVTYPAQDDARYSSGAPIVTIVPGGLDAGSLDSDTSDYDGTGIISVHFVFPGGGDEPLTTGGAFDYRGELCMKALRDVLLYSMGMLTDADGDTITDKLPFALTSCAGVAGYSNGGNITLCTLGSYGPELQGLCWLATWESPIGDQYVKCELGGGSGGPAAAMLNPYYIPGTAGITEAPTPGMESVLSYDPAVTGGIEDPRTGAYHEIQGLFYLDENENSAYDAGEFRFSGSAGPGSDNGSVPLPRVYFSDELTTVITDNLKSVLGGAALPGWLAGRDLVEQFWKIRDGSLWIDDVHKHFPDMPVIVSGTSRDHMQAQPDHPHLVSFQKGLGEADHFFWRVNPDAAYIAALSGGAQADYPEYKAFEALEYSEGFSETLPPPGSSVGAASVCELADRVMYDEWSADLDEVIVE